MAAKRPHLVPIYDTFVAEALLPTAKRGSRRWWGPCRQALAGPSGDELAAQVATIRAVARPQAQASLRTCQRSASCVCWTSWSGRPKRDGAAHAAAADQQLGVVVAGKDPVPSTPGAASASPSTVMTVPPTTETSTVKPQGTLIRARMAWEKTTPDVQWEWCQTWLDSTEIEVVAELEQTGEDPISLYTVINHECPAVLAGEPG